jgi:hypothetical protein
MSGKRALLAALILAWLLPAGWLPGAGAAGDSSGDAQPTAVFLETRYTFAPVPEGNDVVHDFTLQNRGAAPLEVQRVKTG